MQNTFVQALSKIKNWPDSQGNIENVDVSSSPEEGYKSDSETTANNVDCNIDLKSLCRNNLNKIIVAHLNIISLRNKLEFLIQHIEKNIDMLMISETKLDESFPIGHFFIKGFRTPFRLDINSPEVVFR